MSGFEVMGRGEFTHIRFWNVTERIVRGVKSVGGFGESAVPAGGSWVGV